MPYLPADEKLEMDLGYAPHTVGQLTYCFQREIRRFLELKQMKYRYQDLAEVTAALTEAREDFRDRIVRPYEKKKREENGDVW